MTERQDLRSAAPLVAFITMGCAKNEVDSAQMAHWLQEAGYRVSDDPESADVVVVNTCSFIQEATEESIDAVLAAADLESVRQGRAKLVVAGCMPARYGQELACELPEASAFVPCALESQVASIIDGVLGRKGGAAALGAPAVADPAPDQPFAYVKISDGCDRFCSYCTIPFIRGRYHSFPLEDIARQVEGLVAAGKREIVLIAQDTGRWGTDFNEPSSLAALLEFLAVSHPDTWFRVMYLQPEGVTDQLVATMAAHPNICRYFDLPFQHCDPVILRRMNRRGGAQEYLQLSQRLRAALPGVALRTTLMVGFPGETEAQFQALCDFVEQAEFDYVGAFAYSREEGTRAFDMDDQVDDDEKIERLQALRDVADAVSAAVIARRAGTVTDVLVCGQEEDGQRYGRSQCQAPDVDGVTFVDGGATGQIVSCRIQDTLGYEMEGEICG